MTMKFHEFARCWQAYEKPKGVSLSFVQNDREVPDFAELIPPFRTQVPSDWRRQHPASSQVKGRFMVFVDLGKHWTWCEWKKRESRGRKSGRVLGEKATLLELIYLQNSREILFTKDVCVKRLSLICLFMQDIFWFFGGLGLFLEQTSDRQSDWIAFLVGFIVASSRQTMK